MSWLRLFTTQGGRFAIKIYIENNKGKQAYAAVKLKIEYLSFWKKIALVKFDISLHTY